MVDVIVVEWLESDQIKHSDMTREQLAAGMCLLNGWLMWLQEKHNQQQVAGNLWK